MGGGSNECRRDELLPPGTPDGLKRVGEKMEEREMKSAGKAGPGQEVFLQAKVNIYPGNVSPGAR